MNQPFFKMPQRFIRIIPQIVIFLTFFGLTPFSAGANSTTRATNSDIQGKEKLLSVLKELESRASWREAEARRLNVVLPSISSRKPYPTPVPESKPIINHHQKPEEQAPKVLEPLPFPVKTEKPEPAEGSESEEPPEKKPRKMPLPPFMNFMQRERDRLSEKGQQYDFDYTGELLSIYKNFDNKRKKVYLDNLNLKLTVDLEKAELARSGTFFLSILGNSGGNITGEHLDNTGIGRIGDLQTLSNLETNESFRLYELWVERPLRRGTILFGLRDLNAEFYTSQYSAFFCNSSFGIGPDVSKNAPVSIFNVTSPAIRIKYPLKKNLTLLYAIFDGYPGSPDENRNGLGLRVSPREGFFNIFELQIENPLRKKNFPGVIKLAQWHHSGKFDDLMNVDAGGNPIRREHNWGSYLVCDQQLVKFKNPERSIGGFLQAGGRVPNDRSLVEQYFGMGLTFTGPFKGREKDVFGIAHDQAKTSSALRKFNLAQGNQGLTTEKGWEIGYRVQVNDWLTVKPSIQILNNVGGDPTRKESRIFGLRVNSIF